MGRRDPTGVAKRAAGEKPADASTPAAVWTLVDVWTRVVVAMPAVAVTLVDAATRADVAMGVARAEVPLTAAVAAAETPRETAEGGLPELLRMQHARGTQPRGAPGWQHRRHCRDAGDDRDRQGQHQRIRGANRVDLARHNLT